MGIGIPGSGKTTILKPFAESHSYVYISPDDIRAQLLGDETDQSKNVEVWREAYRRVADSLKKGKTVVFDATFAKDFERKDFIQFARRHGADKINGAFAKVSPKIAYKRNRARGRIVPLHAIERMNTMLEKAPPIVEDGFDRVFDLTEIQENTI
jgi:predicted kinase